MLNIKVAASFAELYEKIEDFKKANKYIKEYYTLKDSIFSLEKQNQIVELQEKYKTEKQKTTIDLLKKEKEIDQIKINKQNVYIYTTTFIIVLVLVILLLVTRLDNPEHTDPLKPEIEKLD